MVERVSSLKTGIKYKDTPIGKIPVDWEITTLGKIAYLEYGASLPEEKRKKGNVPVYGSNGIVGYHCDQLVDGPGIIIGRKGTVGAVNWVDENFWAIDTTYYITREQSKENLKWLLYLLSHSHLERLHITTGVPGLNRDEAHSLIIPIPPCPEQKKIADILATVDEVIEETTQIIEKTKELKKGLMQRLLTRGIGHNKFKKTEIGEIPVEWEVKRLEDLCMGKAEYGANTPAIDKADNLPRYIRITDITEDGKLTNTSWQSIQKEGAQPYLLKEGDLVFARSGATVGKTYLFKKEDGECAFAGYLIRFKPNPMHLLAEFLFHFTHSSYYYNWIKGMLRAGAQPNINAREYSNMLVPKPAIEEQKKIVGILNVIDEEIEKGTDHKERLEVLKKGLLQVLLTGRLRVPV